MFWFKIVLLVFLSMELIECIAKAGGWKPEYNAPAAYAFGAVMMALLAVGVWFWL